MAKFARVILVLLLSAFCAVQGFSWFPRCMNYDQPSWSPDSRMLCFRAEIWDGGRGDGGPEYVYKDIMTLDLRNRARVMLTPSVETYVLRPEPSHNGTNVAFTDGYGIWIASTKTGAIVSGIELDPVGDGFHPEKIAWSPDNKKIACIISIENADWSVLIFFDLGSWNKMPDPYDYNPRGENEWQKALKRNLVERVVEFVWADGGTIAYATGDMSRDSSPREYWQLDTASMTRKRINLKSYKAFLHKTSPGIESREDDEIWLRKPSGGWVELLNLQGYYPCLSPDGGRLVFVTEEYKGSQILKHLVVARIDGTGAKRIASVLSEEYGPPIPFWLPDGKILYNCDGAFYTISPDGGRPIPLTAGNGSKPVWTLDGKGVLFTTMAEGREELRLVDPATRMARPVNDAALIQYYRQASAKISNRALSPDGRYLACVEVEADTLYGYTYSQINIYDKVTGENTAL